MMQQKRAALLCSLLGILLVAAGCISPEATPPSEPSLEEGPFAEIETAVQDWVQDNMAELSEDIGILVTGDLPLARDIVAKAIETALGAWLEYSIEQTQPLEGTNKYSARVKLEFPLELEIPLVGKIGYRVSIAYDIVVENGQVTETDIDISSFQMTSSSS